MLPLVPIAWDQALSTEIGGGTLKVVDLDGLLRLKFRAGGPQDLLDAARLVLRHPEFGGQARGSIPGFASPGSWARRGRTPHGREACEEDGQGRPAWSPPLVLLP